MNPKREKLLHEIEQLRNRLSMEKHSTPERTELLEKISAARTALAETYGPSKPRPKKTSTQKRRRSKASLERRLQKLEARRGIVPPPNATVDQRLKALEVAARPRKRVRRPSLDSRLTAMERKLGLSSPEDERQRREQKFAMDSVMGRTEFTGIHKTETMLQLGCETSADQQKARVRPSKLTEKERDEMKKAMGLTTQKIGVVKRGNTLLLGAEEGTS